MFPRRRVQRLPINYAASLAWFGEGLLDGLLGPTYFGLDGSISDHHISFAYRFDTTVVSPSGQYLAVLESKGTKALLIEAPGKLLRELNRSYFCADDYTYPLTFLTLPDGREALLHCPDEYNRLEIEDCATGERLTASSLREPEDIFHSRLTPSPDGTRFFSAGWVWHPVDVLPVYSIAEALRDPRHLDSRHSVPGHDSLTAVWKDNETIWVALASDALIWGKKDTVGEPARLEKYNVEGTALTLLETFALEEDPVQLLPLNDEYFVGFHECPKLFYLPSGKVIERWEELPLGKLDAGKLAMDIPNRRFALVQDREIVVVTFEETD
ncbi:hypothetical protein [Armatimonas sp.]|uniref:hypothetical protein n=1 Tax=Armatimonas sp. TaxID=1872638 RepID=UPI00286C580C|nr:hypothetical protein [Armatimonas sp.]